MTAQTAYMMWRQMSGEARPTAGQQNAGVAIGRVSGPVNLGPTLGESLNTALNSLAGFANAYTGATKVANQQADDKVLSWMRTKTVEEARQIAREQNTPFQDDPLAMAALHRNLGATLAFEVEEKIQGQVKQGVFKTPEEADKARIEALEGAKAEYVLSMGISPEDKAFRAGFDLQHEDRRYLIQKLQQDVTDKNLRKQALIGVNTSLTAPLTPEVIASSPKFAADYMVNTLSQAQLTGLLRSPEEYMQALNHGLTNLQGVPGGAEVLTELGNREVDMMGQKGTLRDFLGGGAFDAAVLKARDQENTQNVERFGQFQQTVLKLTQAGNVPAIDLLIEQKSKESQGKTTNEIESLYRARAAVIEARDREIAKLNEKVMKQNEEFGQLTNGMDRLNAFLQGGLVSNDYKALGFKDKTQGMQGEELLLNSIEDPQERIKTAIKLAGKFTDGFSASALQEWKDRGRKEFELYATQIANGNENVAVPPMVQNLTQIYESDPVAFGLAFGDAKDHPYTTLYDAGKEVGLSLSDMVKSKAKWDNLPKDKRQEADKELTRALNSVKGGQESYVNKSVQAIAANLMAAGISAPTAVDTAMDRFKQQHVEINKGWVHKSFFTDNAKDATASQFAEEVFKTKVTPKLLQAIGNPSDYGVIYSPTTRSIWITDPTTGKSIQYSREQMLEASEFAAEEIRSKANLQQTTVIEKQTQKAKEDAVRKRMSDKRKENGMFPYNRPETNIYGDVQGALADAAEALAQGTKEQRGSSKGVRDASAAGAVQRLDSVMKQLQEARDRAAELAAIEDQQKAAKRAKQEERGYFPPNQHVGTGSSGVPKKRVNN